MRLLLASSLGIHPETQCFAAWEAATVAAAAHYAATGEASLIFLDRPAWYWSQYLGGNPLRPVSGYTGIRLRSGCHIGGVPGAGICDMPAEAGGKPGQLVGVRLNTAPVENVGLHGIRLWNRQGITSQNETFHAAWFHAANPTARIENVTIHNVWIDEVKWGDGLYFGQGVSRVHVDSCRVERCSRHGVTLSSNGAGRSGYLIENCYLSRPGVGDGFHIETDGLDRRAAYDALAANPDVGWAELGAALGCVHDVTLRRCFAEGNIGINGAADWLIADCTIRPEPGGIGGGIRVTEAPGGTIVGVQQRCRQRAANSSARALALTGAMVRDLQVADWSVEHLPCVDGAVTSAITSRMYSAQLPGWPSRVRIEGQVALPAGATPIGAHQGTGWDVSQLRVVRPA